VTTNKNGFEVESSKIEVVKHELQVHVQESDFSIHGHAFFF